MFGTCQLDQRKISEGNRHRKVDGKGIKEEESNSLFDLMETFCIRLRQFIGWNWLLGSGSTHLRNMSGRLIFGVKWCIVVESKEECFDIAGNKEAIFVVGIVPLNGYPTE